MKNLKILIAIAFIAIMVPIHGQTDIVIKFEPDKFFSYYTGRNQDTLNAAYLLTKSIYIQRDEPYHYLIKVQADSSGDATNVTFKLRGSYDNTHWVDISSGTWYVTTSDTTIEFNSLTNNGNIARTTSQYTKIRAATNINTGANEDTIGVNADTLYLPQVVTTVGQHTITSIPTNNSVTYNYLQVYFLGAGAGADMKLKRVDIRLFKYQ